MTFERLLDIREDADMKQDEMAELLKRHNLIIRDGKTEKN